MGILAEVLRSEARDRHTLESKARDRDASAGVICSNSECEAVAPETGSIDSVCPACGSFLLSECLRCGARLPTDVRDIRFCLACGNALRVKRAPGIERRTHERIASSIEALITESPTQTDVTDLITGRVTDVGVGGCYVNTQNVFPKDTKVALHFSDETETFNCDGIVIRSTPGKGMGLAFVQIDSDQNACLTEWLKMLNRRPEVTIERAERRAHLRFTVRMAAEIVEPRSGASLNCWITDLSVSGCYIRAETPFRKGIRIALRVIDEGLVFKTPAIVTHATSGKGMGLAFIDTTPDQEVSLVNWLREATVPTADEDLLPIAGA